MTLNPTESELLKKDAMINCVEFFFQINKYDSSIVLVSKLLSQSSVHFKRAVAVEWQALKPDWQDVRRPFIFKYLCSWLYTNFSKTRSITGRTEIGR